MAAQYTKTWSYMHDLYVFVSLVGEYCHSFPFLKTGVSWRYEKDKENNSILAKQLSRVCVLKSSFIFFFQIAPQGRGNNLINNKLSFCPNMPAIYFEAKKKSAIEM